MIVKKEVLGMLGITLLGLLFFVPHGIWVYNNQTPLIINPEGSSEQMANNLVDTGNKMWVVDIIVSLVLISGSILHLMNYLKQIRIKKVNKYDLGS